MERRGSRARAAVDRLRGGEGGRAAWAVLGLAMLASMAYCLHVTRGTTFTPDELAWVSISPSMNLDAALQPHSGHLVLVSHLLYKAVLETIGTDYLTFRLLTLAAVFLAVGLTFAFLRRRVGDWLALAPSIVLLFFGSDAGHLLQGNGFTIMFAIACGVGAFLALEKGGGWDAAACGLLCLGIATYTVALPFLAGAIVLLALLPAAERWRRAWVVAVPFALYVAWRVWIEATGADFSRGGVDVVNILLLPDWIFVSLSGVTGALSGLNYNFEGGGWVGPGELVGPVLAVAALVAYGWRISRGGLDRWFWVTTAAILALFASQVLTWIPDVREPGTSRYLYPDAVAALLVAAESVRGLRVSRAAFVAVWVVVAVALCTNAMIIRDSGASLRQRAGEVRAQVTAVDLLARNGTPRGPGAVPIIELVGDPPVAFTSDASAVYDGLSSADELPTEPEQFRARVDTLLVQALGPRLAGPVVGDRGDCRSARAATGQISLPLPPRAALVSPGGGTVWLSRFASQPIEVGRLEPGAPAVMELGEDGNPTPWTVSVDAKRLTVCELVD